MKFKGKTFKKILEKTTLIGFNQMIFSIILMISIWDSASARDVFYLEI
jgi:hypothetical protein